MYHPALSIETFSTKGNVLIYTLDRDFKLTFLNVDFQQRIEQLYDCTPVIGMPLLNAIGDGWNKDLIADFLEKALKGDVIERIDNAQSKKSYHEKYIPSYYNDKIVGITVVSTLIDTTDDQLLADKLNIEERFRRVSEMSADYAYSLLMDENSDMYFDWYFGAFEKITGYSAEDFLEKMSQKKLIHPEDTQVLKRRSENLKKGDSDISEFRIRHKDGYYIWVEERAESEWYEKGKVRRITGVTKDITKLKSYLENSEKSNKELKRANSLLEAINEAAVIGTWEVDVKKGICYWSRVCYEILEIESDILETIMGEGFRFYKEGKNRDVVLKAFDECIKFGKYYDLELEVITEKGNEKWIRTMGIPKMKDGECVSCYGTYQDITARKVLELEMEKLSLVASETHNGVVMTDPEGVTTWVNKGFEKISGYTFEEVKNKKLGGLLQGAKTSRLDEVAIKQGIQSKKPFTEQILNYRKDGSPYWNELHVTPVFNKNEELTHFIGIQTDVTKKKATELALQKSEERIRDIANSVPGVLIRFIVSENNELKLLYISDRISEIWEIQKDIAENDINVLLNGIKKEDKGSFFNTLKQSAKNLGFWDHNFRIHTKSGKVKWINVRGIPRKQNKNIFWDAIFSDLTPLHEAQIKLENKQLSLQKALDQKNTLFKELHHRIKNNLQLVSSLLYLKSVKSDDDNLKDFIIETSNRIKSISNMHNQLLRLEEVDHLNVKVYVGELLRDLLNIHSVDNNEKRFILDVELAPIRLHVDKVLIIGMLTNEIISNSIKYAYPEGERGIIRMKFFKQNEKYHLFYQDEGRGMDIDRLGGELSTLGLNLIEIFIDQLEARFKYNFTEGVSYSLVFE